MPEALLHYPSAPSAPSASSVPSEGSAGTGAPLGWILGPELILTSRLSDSLGVPTHDQGNIQNRF
eukprot:753772-Alexandrium_andersonii.AAC.1